jgi:hypothetical protein
LNGELAVSLGTQAGEWWKADIESGPSMVHSVHVVNRKDMGGERLARVQITVDGELCGSLPSVTETNVDYTVTCITPVYGTEVRLTQVNDTWLNFQGITVNLLPMKQFLQYVDQGEGCVSGENLEIIKDQELTL